MVDVSKVLCASCHKVVKRTDLHECPVCNALRCPRCRNVVGLQRLNLPSGRKGPQGRVVP